MVSIPQTSGVYKITCIVTGKFYIGSSNNLRDRWAFHKRSLRKGNHYSPYLQRSWDKYGESAFEFEILELVMPWSVFDREQYYLDALQPFGKRGFNTNRTATGMSIPGRKHKAETRAKISASLAGHIVSDETRLKLSEAAKGQECSRETREKISAASKGKKKSKIAAEKTGDAHAKNWVVTTPDGQEMLIRSLQKFCKQNKLTQQSMQGVASGRYTQHKGWKCRYA